MIDSPTIVTNHVAREIVPGFALTHTERNEFDYHDWNAIEQGFESTPDFVRYRGELIDLSQFLRAPEPLNEDWDGYLPDSYFSGLVVKYTEDYDVIVGRYCS